MVAVASCSTSTDVTPSISSADVRSWLMKTPVQKGETWFVICARWFQDFIGQFDELNDTQYSPKKCRQLSPIDNSQLLDGEGSFRRDLIMDMDYRIIPQECWDRLVHEYKIKSGQEPLPVSIIQEGDALGPELYHYQVTLKEKYSNKEVVKHVSRTITLREIETMMRKELGLPPNGEARMELQPMLDCEWLRIEDKSVSLMDTGATESSVIIIDIPDRHTVAIPNGHGPYRGCNEMDGIRVNPAPCNGTGPPSDDSALADGSQPMDDAGTGVGSSRHSASPLSVGVSSPSDLGDRVEAEASTPDAAETGTAASGDSGFSSVPSGCAQQRMEEAACFDISSVGSGLAAGSLESPAEAEAGGAIALPYEPLQAAYGDGDAAAAIPLPYGPLNQGESSVIPLPYGPATQAESGCLAALVEEPSESGVCGLRNLGNTCYMNSALQCLSNVKPLAELFLSDAYEQEINLENSLGMKGQLAQTFAELLKRLWSGKYKSLSPSEMKEVMGKKDKQFLGSRQHDSQELMSAVLDGLHEDLKRPPAPPSMAEETEEEEEEEEEKESDRPEEPAEEASDSQRLRQNSAIFDLVYGNQKSTVVCRNCANVKVTYEPFNMLSLPLPGGNVCRFDVTFVSLARPEERPVRHTLELVSSDTIGHLLAKMAERVGSQVSRLWAAEVGNYRVNQSLSPDLSVLRANGLFSIYVFERPPRKPDPPPPPPTPEGERKEAGATAEAEKEENAMDECSMVETCPVDAAGDAAPLSGQPVVVHMLDSLYSLAFGQPVVFFPPAAPATVSVEEISAYVLAQGCRYVNPAAAAASTSATASTSTSTAAAGAAAASAGAASADPPQGEAPMEETEPPAPPAPLFSLSQIGNDGSKTDLAPDASVEVPGDRIVHLAATWPHQTRTKVYRDSEASAVRYASSAGLSSAPACCSLAHCLDLLTSEDLLDGDNAVECDKCPRSEDGAVARGPATKKIDLWDLPPVLILHLKRFMFMTHTSKLEVPVQFPASDLRLDQWVKGPLTAGVYDLVAVSNHSSHYLDRGHYTTVARNWQNRSWYRFDDDYVTEMEAEPKLDGELAYILVYVRRDEGEEEDDIEDMDTA